MAATEMLRKELLGFQSAQAELLRWKLLAIGGAGAAALGAASASEPFRLLVLAVIPVVAVYCDLLSRDYDIRIALIATFLRSRDQDYARYEEFLATPGIASSSPWFLHHAATLVSSLGACLLVLWVGLQPDFLIGYKPGDFRVLRALVWSGLAGSILVVWITWRFNRSHLRIAYTARSSPGAAELTAAADAAKRRG